MKGIKILNVITSLVVIASSIIVVWAALGIREVVVTTKPDLRASVRPMLMDESRGGSYDYDKRGNFTLHYYHEENIEYLKFDVDVVNIGSGVAYDLDVMLELPGLKYYPSESYGIELYVDGELIGEIGQGGSTFGFTNIILSPHGGSKKLKVHIPFEMVGSIQNLPNSCVLTIEDINEELLLERTLNLDYEKR